MCLWLACICTAQSQDQTKKKTNYSKDPHWINMMKDPNVNYHEACKAFNEFWKERGRPEEEGESQEGEHSKRSFLKRVLKSDEKLREENMQYAFHYKSFIRWKYLVEPFVQPDGSILSLEEQLKIWENARK